MGVAGSSRLVRAVPVVLLVAGISAMWVAVRTAAGLGVRDVGTKEVRIGPVDAVVQFIRPTPSVVLAGISAAAGFAVLVILLDAWAARRVTDPARGPAQAAARPLRREATASRPAGPLHVTALIPARNEALHLSSTLESLRHQGVPPRTVWVIADNCTDDTAGVARAEGAEVYETVANQHRKAGGLNQLLARLLPEADPCTVVLVMDADTVLVPEFIEQALAEFDADPALDAVGGVFFGDNSPGLLGHLQRNEYGRYSRDIARRRARPFVLTGTCTLFRADALAAVGAARGTMLPGTAGQVYDTYSLTEDNEITLALKTLGASMLSPRECEVRTELMPTWRDLWNQRQRWQRGALENIGMYGVTSATARYWAQQFGLGYGVLALWGMLALSVISYAAQGLLVLVGFWFAVGVLFFVERVATVWPLGWKARLLAATLFIELAYSLFLQAVYVDSLVDIVLGRSKEWKAAVVEPVAS